MASGIWPFASLIEIETERERGREGEREKLLVLCGVNMTLFTPPLMFVSSGHSNLKDLSLAFM